MLSRCQSFFNILDCKQNGSAFRKFSKSLNRNFARVADQFAAFTDRVAAAPATVTNEDRARRNCVVAESNDVQHLQPSWSREYRMESSLLLISQPNQKFVRFRQTWFDCEMSGEQG